VAGVEAFWVAMPLRFSQPAMVSKLERFPSFQEKMPISQVTHFAVCRHAHLV
jgi:hypothetical protein